MASGTINQFHLFRSLPPELRVMIWEAAVRPAVPCVHVLVTIASLPTASLTDSTLPRNEDLPASEPQLGVLTDDFSWSVYLWDVSLWTTCKESRATIGRVFTRRGRLGRGMGDYDEARDRSKVFCYTMIPFSVIGGSQSTIIGGAKPHWEIACEFHHDLIVFPDDYQHIVSHLRYWFRKKLELENPYGKHVGFMFSPEHWKNNSLAPPFQFRPSYMGTCVFELVHIIRARYVWFLDPLPRYRHAPGSPAAKSSRYYRDGFLANSWRLVQIDPESDASLQEWDLCGSTSVREVPGLSKAVDAWKILQSYFDLVTGMHTIYSQPPEFLGILGFVPESGQDACSACPITAEFSVFC